MVINKKAHYYTVITLIFTMISIFISVILISCTSVSTQIYKASGSRTICSENNQNLGNTVILPETAWRIDQKEPYKRETMALRAITESFKDFPCGNISNSDGIREFSQWSGMPESELIKLFKSKGIDTIIILRIEELTPYLGITFSLPVLWTGANEADFRIIIISVRDNKIISDMRVRRTTGGPFNIRPADWSEYELKSALQEIMGR
jgi:hypothetical protein